MEEGDVMPPPIVTSNPILNLIYKTIYQPLEQLSTFLEGNMVALEPFYIIACITLICGLVIMCFGKKLPRPKGSGRRASYLLLLVSVLIAVVSTLPVAGKGYDCTYYIYITNCVNERGLGFLFDTDRPVFYLMIHIIGKIFSVPSRISVPVSGVLGAGLLVFSVFVLSQTLFDNVEWASVASLIAAGMYSTRHMAICFLGNMFGIVIMNLYFASILKFLKNTSTRKAIKSTILIVLVSIFHPVSGLFAIIVTTVFCFWEVCRNRGISQASLLVGLHILITTGILLVGSSSLVIGWVMTESFVDRKVFVWEETLIMSFDFLNSMNQVWCREYIWIFLFSICGIFAISAREGGDRRRLLVSWTFSALFLVPLAGTHSGRVMVFFPHAILSAYGLWQICSMISSRSIVRYGKFFVLALFILTPMLHFFCSTCWMMPRYWERGPFSWDSYHAEADQLIWIADNFNVEDVVVVVSRAIFSTYGLRVDYPNLRVGVAGRVLAEVGNNVYVGRLAEFIGDNYSNYGYADSDIDKGVWGTDPLIGYLDRSAPKNLRSKTIIIPSMVYNIDPKEMEILFESAMSGVFILKELTREEELLWLSEYESMQAGGS